MKSVNEASESNRPLEWPGFSVQLKPVGSFCNINCRYCYVEPFKVKNLVVMPPAILKRIVTSCLDNCQQPTFSWHGGEPTLAGLPFFISAKNLMDKYSRSGQSVRNILQTNAISLTPEFAAFLKKSDFGVSISLDGPAPIHGLHRRYRNGKNTFSAVMRGYGYLRQAGIEPSVVCTVTRQSLAYPIEILEFLIETGFRRIKFSPVYDSLADQFSIDANHWFDFLKSIFDEWFRIGNPEIHIRDLDEVIAWLVSDPLTLCSSDQSCLCWVSINPQGELYPCEYLRTTLSYGNIMTMELADIIKTPNYQQFRNLFSKIPIPCTNCEFYQVCGNGCPATRVKGDQLSHEGQYVYCQQRKRLYNVIKDAFEAIKTDSG